MNSIAKKISSGIIVIVMIFIYILIFKSTPMLQRQRAICNASKVLRLPSISLSNVYLEDRILEYQDYSNDFYLGMKKDTFTGFVYAK